MKLKDFIRISNVKKCFGKEILFYPNCPFFVAQRRNILYLHRLARIKKGEESL